MSAPFYHYPVTDNDPPAPKKSSSTQFSGRRGGRGGSFGRPSSRPATSDRLNQDLDQILDSTAGDIGRQFDSEIEKLKAQYGSQIAASGGGGDYGIADALAQLQDVRGNREAIKEVYGEYMDLTGGFGDEAVQAALDMIGEATPAFEAIAAETEAGYAAAEEGVEGGIQDTGALIGAGEAAIIESQADALDSLAIFEEQELERAEMAESLLGLQGAAMEKRAEADLALDRGEMTRRALLTDIEFGQMEEAAAQRLAAARRAAAAAAARRRALARERDAAIRALTQEKYQSMKLNPHEAGTAAAMEYLKGNAGNLDYNRQQLVLSTVENAISEQVPAARIPSYVRDKGIPLTTEEKRHASGAIYSYTNGMRFQSSRDRSNARAGGSTGKNFGR